MKRFNITGTCYPNKHYMVDISHTLAKMQTMVDEGAYLTINRGRQYGKTTTMALLAKRLAAAGYVVFFISFEGLEDEVYASAEAFYHVFFGLLHDRVSYGLTSVSTQTQQLLMDAESETALGAREAGRLISSMCMAEEHPIVVLIDEVDNAGNHPMFLRFLGLLRDKYLHREEIPTFHSVILAGVYDIKNLKLKIRDESEHQYNSPWNIAVGYTGDMALPVDGIAGMLTEYEDDHHIGMDVQGMAKQLFDYTSGYPFLVSRLCQIMDEEDALTAWTAEGFQRAVKQLLGESNTLFDDMAKKLDQFPALHDALYEMLYTGKIYNYNTYADIFNLAAMFGYVVNINGKARVSNRIFETWTYDLFVTEASLHSDICSGVREFTIDGKSLIEAVV